MFFFGKLKEDIYFFKKIIYIYIYINLKILRNIA